MSKFSKFIRYMAFLLEVLLCYVVQSTPGLSLEVFGGRPILLVPLALTIAVFEEEIPAITFGVICGLMADSGYSGPVGYYAIMLAVLCYIVSILMENYIHTNLRTTMIIATLSIPIIIFMQFVLFYVAMGYGNVWEYFLSHYVSRMVYTWAFVPLFYAVNRFIAAKTKGQ